MICPYHFKFRLQTRNEGKLKSYESCTDVRAWSHDYRQRDRYLREWIKSDMPHCVVPTCGLTRLLTILSYNSRGKLTPRCHIDCKSRVLLESICNSCQAMKQCLKNDPYFEKYFIEEEFETSHWPCDRCLEALKSIKLFWKIIVEKVFQTNITKKDNNGMFEEHRRCHSDSLRHVAQSWQRDIVHQALFVKTCNPPLNSSSCKSPFSSICRKPILLHSSSSKNQLTCTCRKLSQTSVNTSQCSSAKPPSSKSRVSCTCAKPMLCSKNFDGLNVTIPIQGDCSSILSRVTSKTGLNSAKSQKNRVTISDRISCSTYDCDKPPRKKHCTRCTSVRVRSMDVGCDPYHAYNENPEVNACKINLEYLQKNYDMQRSEIDELKKENNFLKVQLENVNKKCKYTSPYVCPGDDFSVAIVQKPLECCMEFKDIQNTCTPKNIDSEMYITMQNCKNKHFRHVSLLQVLHKTNEPILKDIKLEGVFYKKEDPIDLLTKVRDTLGAIVRREMSIAGSKRQSSKKFEIDATFQSAVSASKSSPSFKMLPSFITLNDGPRREEIPAV